VVAPLADPLSLAFDRMPHGVIVSEEDGTIVYANPPAAATFGQSSDALIGQPLSRLLPRSSGDTDDDPWTEFWRDPQGRAATVPRSAIGLKSVGTTFPLEVSIDVLLDGTRRHAVAALTDVTERTNLEARLAAATHAHLGFQRLVFEIAARFVRIGPERVDETITDSLREIGEALQMDRAIIRRIRRGESAAAVTHHWHRRGSSPLPPLPVASIPWVISTLEAGEAACYSTIDEIPIPSTGKRSETPDRCRERPYHCRRPIRSKANCGPLRSARRPTNASGPRRSSSVCDWWRRCSRRRWHAA
jgi:PAS domain S-box-containing protein